MSGLGFVDFQYLYTLQLPYVQKNALSDKYIEEKTILNIANQTQCVEIDWHANTGWESALLFSVTLHSLSKLLHWYPLVEINLREDHHTYNL